MEYSQKFFLMGFAFSSKFCNVALTHLRINTIFTVPNLKFCKIVLVIQKLLANIVQLKMYFLSIVAALVVKFWITKFFGISSKTN